MTRPFLEPETPDETSGLVNNVVFAEGLVYLGGVYYLYYGGGDATSISPLIILRRTP
jgi:predicted GH43/DUF377 family glycosyl hydrolase